MCNAAPFVDDPSMEEPFKTVDARPQLVTGGLLAR
jgi:hypothetical protein